MKNPFQSLTIWGLILVTVANFLEPYGVKIDTEVLPVLLEELVALWPELLEAAGLVMAFIGRVRATKPISLTGK